MNILRLISLLILTSTLPAATAQERADEAATLPEIRWQSRSIEGRVVVLTPDGRESPVPGVTVGNVIRLRWRGGERTMLKAHGGQQEGWDRYFTATTDDSGRFAGDYPLKFVNEKVRGGATPIHLTAYGDDPATEYSDDLELIFWGSFALPDQGDNIKIVLQPTIPIRAHVTATEVDELDSERRPLMLTLHEMVESGSGEMVYGQQPFFMVQPLSRRQVELRAPAGSYELLMQPTVPGLRAVSRKFTVAATNQPIDLGVVNLPRDLQAGQAMPNCKILEAGGRLRDGREVADVVEVGDSADQPTILKIDAFEASERWLLLRFWRLSCETCIGKGMPKLVEFQEEFTGDPSIPFEVVAVHHGSKKTLAEVRAELESRGKDWQVPMAADWFEPGKFYDGETADLLGSGATLFDVLIDDKGVIREISSNALPTLRRELGIEKAKQEQQPTVRWVKIRGKVVDTDGETPAVDIIVSNRIFLELDARGNLLERQLDTSRRGYRQGFELVTDERGFFEGEYPFYSFRGNRIGGNTPVYLTARDANVRRLAWGLFTEEAAVKAEGDPGIEIALEKTVMINADIRMPWLNREPGLEITDDDHFLIELRPQGLVFTFMSIVQPMSQHHVRFWTLPGREQLARKYKLSISPSIRGIRAHRRDLVLHPGTQASYLGTIALERVVELNQPMPEWEIVDGQGVTRAGKKVDANLKIADFRDRLLLIVFFSHNCQTCIADELPWLDRLYEASEAQEKPLADFDVVVFHDRSIETLGELNGELERLGRPVRWPLVLDRYDARVRSKTFDKFGILGTPARILVDGEGKVVAIGKEAIEMLKRELGIEW